MPSKEEDWMKISNEFEKQWNFPHCIGALDGKHVLFQKPIRSGSTYFKYKHTFSIVLMALVDADYNFIYIDVGAQERISDAGVYNNCKLSEKLENNTLHVPSAEILPGSDILCPYMIVADDAFPLRSYLMKPFSRRGMKKDKIIFNYRLSRARRVVENAFGMLANRFRVFRAPLFVNTLTAKKVVLAATVLHNMLRAHGKSNVGTTPDTDLEHLHCDAAGLANLQVPDKKGRPLDEAKLLRDKLAGYFLGPGSVEF